MSAKAGHENNTNIL